MREPNPFSFSSDLRCCQCIPGNIRLKSHLAFKQESATGKACLTQKIATRPALIPKGLFHLTPHKSKLGIMRTLTCSMHTHKKVAVGRARLFCGRTFLCRCIGNACLKRNRPAKARCRHESLHTMLGLKEPKHNSPPTACRPL